MAAGFAFVLMLFVALAFTVGLYLLIADETSNPTVMDREQAEAEAKRRGGLQQGQNYEETHNHNRNYNDSHHDHSERAPLESDTRSDRERATRSRSDHGKPSSDDSDTTEDTSGWEFDHET
ncbi:hypothetical protein C483_06722 [Natrialba hulunbeirensis JCM 10989]|uniref:Uncharacterized protein n=1 Tax=Natrialba hulunbeirensis JCM 10989 TaxID=1227493 RepID=M0A230_9EURY|nr:hypothetical protein [Natrialba hulunbeirensis]ELY92820.1 hypothetical protein C483_06722 [Natrialba hulunbeirensis JCM 10989]